MKSLKESILGSTSSGKKAAVISGVENLLHVTHEKDFYYDDNTGKVCLWDLPKETTIKLDQWPDGIQFQTFDAYTDKLVIEINGNAEYEKFKKCFDCTIGEYKARNLGKPGEPKIIFSNCDINTADLSHRYYCKVIFKKCKVNLMNGINATSILIRGGEVQMPYGFDNLTYFDRLK